MTFGDSSTAERPCRQGLFQHWIGTTTTGGSRSCSGRQLRVRGQPACRLRQRPSLNSPRMTGRRDRDPRPPRGTSQPSPTRGAPSSYRTQPIDGQLDPRMRPSCFAVLKPQHQCHTGMRPLREVKGEERPDGVEQDQMLDDPPADQQQPRRAGQRHDSDRTDEPAAIEANELGKETGRLRPAPAGEVDETGVGGQARTARGW